MEAGDWASYASSPVGLTGLALNLSVAWSALGVRALLDCAPEYPRK